LPGTIDCKVVLIDGVLLKSNPNVDLNDLKAVEKAFKL